MRFGFLSEDFFRPVYRQKQVGNVAAAPSGPYNWRPLRGRLCGNEEFESASTEARSESSGWVEIIVEGKLGKNNSGRLADARQARAPPILPVAVRTCIEYAL
jgi:hypothetical protein